MKRAHRLTYKEWLGKTMSEYRREAAAYGVSFNISSEWVGLLISRPFCYFCGRASYRLYATKDLHAVRHLAIARIDTTYGFTEGNTQASCHRCKVRQLKGIKLPIKSSPSDRGD